METKKKGGRRQNGADNDAIGAIVECRYRNLRLPGAATYKRKVVQERCQEDRSALVSVEEGLRMFFEKWT
jgi:hypothetical protein